MQDNPLKIEHTESASVNPKWPSRFFYIIINILYFIRNNNYNILLK